MNGQRTEWAMLTYQLGVAAERLRAHVAEGSPFLRSLASLADWYVQFENHFSKVASGGQELPAVVGAMHGHLANTSKVARKFDVDGFFSSAADLHELLASLLPADEGPAIPLLEKLASLRKLFSTYIAHQSAENALPLLMAAREFQERLQAFQFDLNELAALLASDHRLESDEQDLSLIFDSSQSFHAFWRKLQAIDELHADLCELLQIECKPLRILKIESGSEWIYLAGNAAVIALLTKILYDAYKFVHRNYTREGLLEQTAHELKQAEALLDTIKKFNKAKVDTGDAEAQASAAVQRISRNLNELLAHESRFVVGDRQVRLEEEPYLLKVSRPPRLRQLEPPPPAALDDSEQAPPRLTDERPKE
jgi:hypothetical protein